MPTWKHVTDTIWVCTPCLNLDTWIKYPSYIYDIRMMLPQARFNGSKLQLCHGKRVKSTSSLKNVWIYIFIMISTKLCAGYRMVRSFFLNRTDACTKAFRCLQTYFSLLFSGILIENRLWKEDHSDWNKFGAKSCTTHVISLDWAAILE